MRIYLDNCCYNRPYDDQSYLVISLETQAKLQIQKDIKKGRYDLVSSYMLRLENSQNPFVNRRQSTEEFIVKNTAEYVGVEKIPIIASCVEDIMKTGVKEKDAIHVACAIEAGCEYFISTDKRLLKYSSDRIKMVNPMEFILVASEGGDGNEQ